MCVCVKYMYVLYICMYIRKIHNIRRLLLVFIAADATIAKLLATDGVLLTFYLLVPSLCTYLSILYM